MFFLQSVIECSLKQQHVIRSLKNGLRMRIEIQEKGIFAMYSFQNDYSEGAHPNILRALETINYHQNNSYGLDEHSDNARELIQ